MIYGFIFLIISGINGNINYISINKPEVITMSLITINGTQYNVTENIKLMPFLRDNLHLTSVKNGCNEGACGNLYGHNRRKSHEGMCAENRKS